MTESDQTRTATSQTLHINGGKVLITREVRQQRELKDPGGVTGDLEGGERERERFDQKSKKVGIINDLQGMAMREKT